MASIDPIFACVINFSFSFKIIQRDLAARNVLVVHNGKKKVCKLTDFGLSRNIAGIGIYTEVTEVCIHLLSSALLSYSTLLISTLRCSTLLYSTLLSFAQLCLTQFKSALLHLAIPCPILFHSVPV